MKRGYHAGCKRGDRGIPVGPNAAFDFGMVAVHVIDGADAHGWYFDAGSETEETSGPLRTLVFRPFRQLSVIAL
jgi:hypothetical protein